MQQVQAASIHIDMRPLLYCANGCNIAKYTLIWTHFTGIEKRHVEFAESKEHAFSLAVSNAGVNFQLFDYLLTYSNINTQIQQFLWLRKGKIN